MTNEKIFTVRLPGELLEELQALAKERGVTVAYLIRRFIQLGLVVTNDSKEGPRLMLKDGDNLRQVVLL